MTPRCCREKLNGLATPVHVCQAFLTAVALFCHRHHGLLHLCCVPAEHHQRALPPPRLEQDFDSILDEYLDSQKKKFVQVSARTRPRLPALFARAYESMLCLLSRRSLRIRVDADSLLASSARAYEAMQTHVPCAHLPELAPHAALVCLPRPRSQSIPLAPRRTHRLMS